MAVTKRKLAAQDGESILSSYHRSGNHPKVTRLVRITAFAPHKGESVATKFAADVDAQTAAFMADSQVPCTWSPPRIGHAIYVSKHQHRRGVEAK